MPLYFSFDSDLTRMERHLSRLQDDLETLVPMFTQARALVGKSPNGDHKAAELTAAALVLINLLNDVHTRCYDNKERGYYKMVREAEVHMEALTYCCNHILSERCIEIGYRSWPDLELQRSIARRDLAIEDRIRPGKKQKRVHARG